MRDHHPSAARDASPLLTARGDVGLPRAHRSPRAELVRRPPALEADCLLSPGLRRHVLSRHDGAGWGVGGVLGPDEVEGLGVFYEWGFVDVDGC